MKVLTKRYLKDKYLSLISFGIDPLKFKSLLKIPFFIKSCVQFKRAGGKISEFSPILSDMYEGAGSSSGDYFHQDLIVAQYVFKNSPSNHLDVGSRIDGFVSHVATFREINVLDIRPLFSSHKNIIFLRHNLIDSYHSDILFDSISCLHAIEHFGLGRYGDPIDPIGHIKAFKNMLKLLVPNGRLYISFPIALESETIFNQQRYIKYDEIFKWDMSKKVTLENFDFIDPDGKIHLSTSFETLVEYKYGCGVYTLVIQ